jgi:antirestriction protein ArdC
MTRYSRTASASAPRDHYREITDRIIAALDAGTPPWRKPWNPDVAGGPAMPRNAVTGKKYRGINVLTLGMSTLAFGSGDPRWATYKQASSEGWQVRRGEKSTTGFFYKRLEVHDSTKPDDDDATRHIPLLRAFSLFHATQIDGVPPYSPPTIAEAPWRTPDAAQTILTNSGAVLRIGGDRAFYSPVTDHIQMPPDAAFGSAGAYCSTLIHELGHWTGHGDRLDRDLKTKQGSADYAREELRAEISQVMVCAELGIADSEFHNSASYIADWATRLREDRKEIFRAAADAQRIADYLLAFHPDYASQTSPASDDQAAPVDDTDAPTANDTVPLAA